MGASGWFYRSDYDADPQRALDHLRRQVFDSGEFVFEPDLEILELSGMAARDPELFARLENGEPPQTPDEATNWSAPDGTHSILDITTIGEPPGYGIAWPLSSDFLADLFGTDTPETDLVERVLPGIDPTSLGVERWQGVFVVGYRDSQPEAIFFTGFSGD